MKTFEIILIAIGLSMDAFAVSVTGGATIKNLKIRYAFKIAFAFGLFQAIMPIIGWLAGITVRDMISGIDHWIAFGLLFLIGCKMIYESFRFKNNRKEKNILNDYTLFILTIATNIDALAIGISFAFLTMSIITPVIIIGIITFGICFVGIYIGKRMGHILGNKAELFGGVILILIGIKILIEHLL